MIIVSSICMVIIVMNSQSLLLFSSPVPPSSCTQISVECVRLPPKGVKPWSIKGAHAMAFFDADPERPRLKFKDVDPFSGSLGDGKSKQMNLNENSAVDNSSTAGATRAISSVAAVVSTERIMGASAEEILPDLDADIEQEVKGIATEGARRPSGGAIRSVKKLLPKRVSFAGNKSNQALQPDFLNETEKEPAPTPTGLIDHLPDPNSEDMDVELAPVCEATVDNAGPSLKPLGDIEVHYDTPETVANSLQISSSSSSSSNQMEAVIADDTEDETDDEEKSNDIISAVKDQQACVTKEVEDHLSESVRDRRQQALETSQSLVSDPLMAISRAMELHLLQRGRLSSMKTFLEELEAVLETESAAVPAKVDSDISRLAAEMTRDAD